MYIIGGVVLTAVLLIRIRIHMFLGLLDPDPLVRGMDPDLVLLTLSKNSKKTLDLSCFVTSFYGSLRNYHVTTS